MKTFKLFTALMIAVVCVGLSSCSKDDESNFIDNSLDINLLYGTWVRESEGYNGSREKEVLTFKSNGTWNRTEYTNGDIRAEEGHTFTYYKDTRVLALKYEEMDNEPTGYTIIALTNNTFTWLDDESLFTYTRQK